MENNKYKDTKKTMFSAVQPSGSITLGNYLGAIKRWKEYQDDYNCIFALADLHTITVRQDPEKFHKNIMELYALFLACGIDPKKSIFFIQSHVHTHAELSWILSCFTQFGELSRMTQFKDKSKKYTDNVNVGLFCYPVLMASDILLYDADFVPIGEDQKQHVELTRNIAQRFNGIYGDTFVVPNPVIPKVGARIMSLQNPNSKMSKSDDNPNSCVFLLDSPDDIMKKFKKAVTDSGSSIKITSGIKTGINNLINIYSSVTGMTISKVESDFEGKGYGEFKKVVGEIIIEKLLPIQNEFKKYMQDLSYIEKMYKEANEKAIEISQRKLSEVKKKIGYII